ncbi:MAG: HAD-IA family hydrolase [Oscillospiraceae bacterium]|nr:HAD-IA family hydrolase [Oscillospiraceae bacterium]
MVIILENFDVILFDLDGTVIDSEEGITKCVRYTLEKFGITENSRERLIRFIGPSLIYSFTEFYGFDKAQAEAAVAVYRERYSVTGIMECRVIDGIPEALKLLSESGKRIGLATSKPEVYAEKILKAFEIEKYFDVITGAELDGSRIDKADVIEECLRRMGYPDRKSVLMVGDRKHDIEGAKLCGVCSAGIPYNFTEPGEFEAAGAEYIFDSPVSLARAVLRL